MVDELLSDEEREEALREWWSDNWRWIIGGVVLGVALLVGWHYWQNYREQRAEQASTLYGEVQAAESRSDFIHKMRVVLKELKECRTALKIIIKKEMIKPAKKLDNIFKETHELIAIIAKGIETAAHNADKLT